MSQLFTQPALLVLDVQKGFDDPYWGKRNNLQAENSIQTLLTEWRKRDWTIIYSQHLSLDPQSPLYYKNANQTDFMDIVSPLPGEVIMQKNVNSAFIGTQLESYLKSNQIKSVVITGLSTQHCVSTTTRMSSNLGFHTFLVSDATAAFEITDHTGKRHTPDDIHQFELAALHKEFATILKTDEVITQLS
ncbi:isochorismatase family protein [Metabacillus halosaccharovorans]|uniref:Isochorismatase family protein n=1 Tax=Metabacillus halosaccharovorans TaxID=930124 RepID=A0ABT3DJD5_9BACI|nr:isochorismatase family protein [Metabacillus halosaccharovorans]MCV9887011.1 isochorismatase family protein [Metabacillus halosaccharovorans]